MNKKTKNEALNRLDVEGFHQADKSPIVLVLDDVRSLNNIGSVFRSADAFRIQEIMLCGITARPPHRDIRKTALGATESVSWVYQKDVNNGMAVLKKKGFDILVLEQTEEAVMLHNFMPDPKKKYAIVLGNEVRGVAQSVVDVADVCIEIPQFGTKHSLNVSVSGGIVMWDIVSKMKLLDSL